MVQHLQQPTDAPPSQVGRRIFRATGALMIVQVILRVFGFVEANIMAGFFGTGEQANAYFAARRIAAPVMQLGEQVIMHSFLPSFVRRMQEQGERDAWRVASTCINLMVLVMAVIAAVGMLFTRNVAHLYLSGWMHANSALIPLTMQLTRVLLVAMIFLAVSSVTYSLLNSYKQFALPALSDLALKGTILVFAIFFARTWGAYALAAGFAVGAVAKLLLQSVGLGKRVAYYRPVLDVKNPGVRQFALLAVPLIAGWAFSTFRGIIETNLISHIPETGSMSALEYARKICDIPVMFFPYVFGIALFPFLTDIAVAGDTARLREMLLSATRLMILIFVPLATAFIVLRNPIVIGIYGSSQFTDASVQLTTAPLIVFSLCMVVNALEIIINQFYFAMSDTIRPTVTGMVMIVVYMTVGYVGVIILGWGGIAIALAILAYRTAKVIALYTMIRRKLGGFAGNRLLGLSWKLALAMLPFALVLALAAFFLPQPGNAGDKLHKMLLLLPYMAAGFIGMGIYLYVLHLLRVEEIHLITNKIRAKLLRRPTAV